MTNLKDLNWIGMVCRIGSVPKLAEHTYTWMFRILVLDLELIKSNYKIICYTTADINLKEKTVTGFILDGIEFKKVTLPIPKINYDYHFGSTDNKGKPGLAYDDFEPWAHENGLKVYPEKSLRKIANDKFVTAQLLAACDKSIMPRTELFTRERAQMESFFQETSSVFIKPRNGSGGNKIFNLRKENNRYTVNFYSEGKTITHHFSSIPQFLSSLQSDKYDRYIIQAGVDCIRYENRIFDIRVGMFKDGNTWHFIHEIRLGAKGKEISNGSQGGGDTLFTEKTLKGLFGAEKTAQIIEKIRTSTQKIAAFVNDHIEDKVTELAFDVLVDKAGNIHIAEINIKPGLSGGFKMYDHFFEMSEEEKHIFETLAVKHGEYLAKSLLYRARTA